MPTLKETIDLLDYYHNSIVEQQEYLQSKMASNIIPKPQKDEIQSQVEKQIETLERFKQNALEDLVNFPPHHARHFLQLAEFQKGGIYDKSVFIMTKFPNGKNPKPIDEELKKIIQCVRDAVTENGFVPRIALDKKFHPGLWDNVEMYLLGCKRGVAIVENKYLNELNPNVTMEWGWMRGMDKDVLYLVENTFDLARADITGLIQDTFSWENPETDIKQAVKTWLKGD